MKPNREGTRVALLAALIGTSFSAAIFSAESIASPLEPQAELRTFQLADENLAIELVCAEPEVLSPVAIAFDPDGRLFVAEMSDYPAGPVAGRIKLLEDRDGDGRYERVTVYADKLPFPNGVMPWKGGVLVTAAPNIWFLKDNDGDGRADERRALLTGFGEGNQQLRANGLFWGLDNWIYGANGRSDGEVRWSDVSSGRPVSIRKRDFRFRPDTHEFEAIAGQSQFGAAHDDWGDRFLSWNTIPVRHEVLPERYLNRNRYLAVTESVANLLPLDDPGQVFPRTPPPLVFNNESPSHFNALAGLTIYRGDALGEQYRGNAFAGESLRNLVHRRVLTARGPTFIARRGEEGQEFLASSDPWFHPVNFATGPDGALYVVDFYRRFVEHPGYASENVRGTVEWRAGAEHGRIWRIVAKDSKLRRVKPQLGNADAVELVKHLSDGNGWWRDTAQRLLVERQDRRAIPLLNSTLRSPRSTVPLARLHAIYTLDGLGGLTPSLLLTALNDPHPAIRQHALRLSESFLSRRAKVPASPNEFAATDRDVQKSRLAGGSPSQVNKLRAAVIHLIDDPDPRIRLQLALTLGELESEPKLEALTKLVETGIPYRWQSLAVLSGLGEEPWPFLKRLLQKPPRWLSAPSDAEAQFLEKLGALTGANSSDAVLQQFLTWLKVSKAESRFVLLAGLADGLGQSRRSLREFGQQAGTNQLPVQTVAFGPDALHRLLEEAVEPALSDRKPLHLRLAAVRLLGKAEVSAGGKALLKLLDADQPGEIQSAAARSLSELNHSGLNEAIFARWSQYARPARRQILSAAASSTAMTQGLLDAVEQGRITPVEIDPATRQALQKLPNPEIKGRIDRLLKSAVSPDREQVVRSFQASLRMAGDSGRGAALFAKACMICHVMQGQGSRVGPDLSGISTHSKETLLVEIFDPSRQVPPDYVSYTMTTTNGEIVTGYIAAESATSITLRRSGDADATVLRSQIKELHADGKSLMPEGLEQGMSPQDVADLLGFLHHPDRALLPEVK